MSHYYSRIQGHRGEATRCGTKKSGIVAEATGWDIGGRSEVRFSDHLQTDVVYFYRTRGSNGHGKHLIAAFALVGSSYICINTDYPELLV